MKHSFDVELAKEYGIEEAILLENILFWVKKNAANGRHFHDGRYWTYNSKKAFSYLFPYMTERKIRYALTKLIESGLLLEGNYNQLKMDRTKWYTLSDHALGLFNCENINDMPQSNWEDCIGQNCQMEQTKMSNVLDKNVQAIPYINTDINTDVADASSYNPIQDLQYTLGFLPTGYQAEKFIELYKDVGEAIYHKALKKAADANARNYKYVESTARGIAEGKDFDNKPKEEQYQSTISQETKELYAIVQEQIAAGKYGQ